MAEMSNKENVENQYSDKQKLSIRLNFHKKYSTNPVSYHDWLFGFYPMFEGCRILELGCGTGVFWDGKIDKLPNETSLILSDYSQGMVDVTREKFSSNENISFQQIDIQDIPFETDSIDLVIANSMLYHVPDIPKALSEVKRVLKPGGTFTCSTTGKNGMNHWMHHTLKKFNPKIHAFYEGRVSFTMQNGATFLEKYFDKVEAFQYDNATKVTETNDLIEYIRSTISISGITEEQIEGLDQFFEEIRQSQGAIDIPVDAGTFVSKK
jgi:ubiquinone/menaquinone biosynthesis C-methylase UbiE